MCSPPGDGHCPAEVARRANIRESTLRKAIKRGQISVPNPTAATSTMSSQVPLSSKASRSHDDALAATGIGIACTRADERISAAFGLVQSAATRFEACSDVSLGGLLAGLPALCANGLFSGIGHYLKLPAGFYSCLHILLTLGFMVQRRYCQSVLSHVSGFVCAAPPITGSMMPWGAHSSLSPRPLAVV